MQYLIYIFKFIYIQRRKGVTQVGKKPQLPSANLGFLSAPSGIVNLQIVHSMFYSTHPSLDKSKLRHIHSNK